MLLSKIEILNLWEKDKITLNFENKVTFLTGANGSGKSTLLNIIFDTLSFTTKQKSPATSKHRFWSGKAEFDNGIIINTVSFAEIKNEDSVFGTLNSHVKWQDRSIKDLSALAPDNQFIIATHSPSLVQNGWLDHCLEISAV